MAKDISERHGAKPYGFYFTTRGRNAGDLDSKQLDRSGMYYLGGEVLTLQDVIFRNDPNDGILISNMQSNGWDKIIVNKNSYIFTAPLLDHDVVIQETFQ